MKTFFDVRRATAEADHAKRADLLTTSALEIIGGVLSDLTEDQVVVRFDDIEAARAELEKHKCWASAHKAQVGYILDAEVLYIVKINVDEDGEEEEDFNFPREFADFDNLPTSWAD